MGVGLLVGVGLGNGVEVSANVEMEDGVGVRGEAVPHALNNITVMVERIALDIALVFKAFSLSLNAAVERFGSISLKEAATAVEPVRLLTLSRHFWQDHLFVSSEVATCRD